LLHEFEENKTVVDKFQKSVSDIAATRVKIDYLTNRESIPSLKQLQELWGERAKKHIENQGKITKMRESRG
jgi:hypothetical protein